jgi:hypothetical protein
MLKRIRPPCAAPLARLLCRATLHTLPANAHVCVSYIVAGFMAATPHLERLAAAPPAFVGIACSTALYCPQQAVQPAPPSPQPRWRACCTAPRCARCLPARAHGSETCGIAACLLPWRPTPLQLRARRSSQPRSLPCRCACIPAPLLLCAPSCCACCRPAHAWAGPWPGYCHRSLHRCDRAPDARCSRGCCLASAHPAATCTCALHVLCMLPGYALTRLGNLGQRVAIASRGIHGRLWLAVGPVILAFTAMVLQQLPWQGATARCHSTVPQQGAV